MKYEKSHVMCYVGLIFVTADGLRIKGAEDGEAAGSGVYGAG